MKPGATVYWICESFIGERVESARVLEVLEPTKSSGGRCYRVDPPRGLRHVCTASEVFATAADAWRAAAAEKRASAKALNEIADIYDAKARDAEASP